MSVGYVQGNFLVVPRTVVEFPQGIEPPCPVGLSRGVHWVGWISVLHPGKPESHFAVWQDYKKRGFWFWCEGMQGAVCHPIGTDFNRLIELLELMSHRSKE